MQNSTPSVSGAAGGPQAYGSRVETAPRYDLIPYCVLTRFAARLHHGALRYGEYNWQKGLDTLDVYNHAQEHLQRALNEFRDNADAIEEDHLAAVLCNVAFLMWYQENGNPYESRSQDRVQRPNAEVDPRKR